MMSILRSWKKANREGRLRPREATEKKRAKVVPERQKRLLLCRKNAIIKRIRAKKTTKKRIVGKTGRDCQKRVSTALETVAADLKQCVGRGTPASVSGRKEG